MEYLFIYYASINKYYIQNILWILQMFSSHILNSQSWNSLKSERNFHLRSSKTDIWATIKKISKDYTAIYNYGKIHAERTRYIRQRSVKFQNKVSSDSVNSDCVFLFYQQTIYVHAIYVHTVHTTLNFIKLLTAKKRRIFADYYYYYYCVIFYALSLNSETISHFLFSLCHIDNNFMYFLEAYCNNF
jgi:hypothetical protein